MARLIPGKGVDDVVIGTIRDYCFSSMGEEIALSLHMVNIHFDRRVKTNNIYHA